MTKSYVEIEIRIRGRVGEGAYPVEAKLDDGSFFGGGSLDLERQRLLLAELDPQAYGLELFGALFKDQIRDALNQALGRAKARTGGRLRVRLWIDEAAPELHALPWERLYHIHRGRLIPLATSSLTPFSRFTGLPDGVPKPLRERPLNLLAVLANPRGLPAALAPLEVDQEARNLREAFSGLQRRGQVRVTLLPGVSGVSAGLARDLEREGFRVEEGASTLTRILRLMKDCQVLHLVGHGWFRDGAGALHLEGEDGAWEPVKDDVLVPRLAALDPQPRLVFLSACESAKRSGGETHPFVGLGPMLVQAGIPAVVAMQDLVPMDLARELARDFYRGLFEDGSVDLALNQARNLLFEAEDTDWAIPVLFMRLRDGRLFTADPVLGALEAVRHGSRDERVPIPVEVLHLRGHQDPGALELLKQRSVPAVDLLQAVDIVFRLEQRPVDSLPGVTKRAMASVGVEHRQQAQLVVLVGSQGATKTTQLRRIAHATAAASLETAGTRRVVPVVVDLRGMASERRGMHNPVETLALRALREFWPGLAARSFSELAREHSGVTLRLLLDGTDHLPDRERREAWEQVQDLAADEPSHEYLLGIDSVHFDPTNLKRATDLLVMQPLSRRAVKRFLESQRDPAGGNLYDALESTEMFDLASFPWLLATMLEQARRGSYPKSRSKVLAELVDDAVAKIPPSRGMRSRAGQTLAALAWQMHRELAPHWPVERVFRTMAEVRGNREYSLEELLDEFLERGLFARLGHDTVRFAHPAVRDYCCAQAMAELEREDRERVLDDITASLGRPTRLLWWQDTLVLLSGLLRNPNGLIRMLLHGETLSEGEQVFLAARCLEESRSRSGAKGSQVLGHQVLDALVWRLRIGNVRITARRERAAEVLGRLGMPEAIPYLARVANQKVRTDRQGELTYDYSSMRMAASRALRRMVPRHTEQVAAADPVLARLLELWLRREREELAEWLRSGDVDSRPIAAFALADLYSDEAPEPLEDLVSVFLDRTAKGATRWAVADALTRLDANIVKDRAILPFLDREAGLDPETWKGRAPWYTRLANLIGKLRIQDPTTRAFLDRCLFELKPVGLKARAIQSLGWLPDPSYKELFERIALGDLDALALSDKVTDKDKIYLRCKAIEALGSIGDRDTLTRLREARSDWHLDLDRAFFWASEEISWRSSLAAETRR